MSSKRKAGVRVSESFLAEHPDADPTATELVLNLLSAAAALQQHLDRLLRPFHLATGSFNVLQIVAGAGEAVTPSTIVERLPVKVSMATVTGVLDTLERRGLVRRDPHPDDRRRVHVSLTAAGRSTLDEVVPAVVAAEEEWTGVLSASARASTTDRLGELWEHLR